MPKVHLQGSPTFKFLFHKYLDLALRLELGRTTLGSDGSIARGLGIENTNCATDWPMRRLTVRLEHD
jgi:hypothetical protein